MKNRLLLLLLLMPCSYLHAQNKYDAGINNDQLYLTYNNKNIKFTDLKKLTIIGLLGNPIKVKNKKWETTNANEALTYVYANGEIFFKDGVLTFIEINKPGWALTVKDRNSIFHPFKVGSDSRAIKNIFPVWPAQRDNMIQVPIIVNGQEIESSIIFEIKGHTITHISLFSDES